MKKNYIFRILITLLIISNLVTLYFYKHKSTEYESSLKSSIQNIYFLQGENANWRLKDGVFFLAKNKTYFSGGLLEYVGDKSLNVKYLEINIILKGKDNKVKRKLDSVIHTVVTKDNINILNDNKIPLGHISEPSSEVIDLNSKDDIYINIKYTTNDNKNETEEFRLKGKSINLSKFETGSASIS
ncbi:hypothetical protein [Clostridium sp. ZS2-4]|uniref:hypothetical protein n=1 Tax=Clostridium sp. ZS2-4 TaxID=2987703 RepID=UPI00227CA678|nr:hypothetical protein [Clostridium sp. ZS2-4]MCY6356181.1 hypothetical protein [Clostridium sp. ZS2-4]